MSQCYSDTLWLVFISLISLIVTLWATSGPALSLSEGFCAPFVQVARDEPALAENRWLLVCLTFILTRYHAYLYRFILVYL